MTSTLRLAMIGLDTSHAEQFALRLHDDSRADHVPGARVVSAFPQGSDDLPTSRDRIEGFTAALRDDHRVRIAPSLDEALDGVDGVLILSLDGRVHLEQVRKALKARCPIFLDKPVAASLAESRQIYAIAAEAGVPIFSASALRWSPGVVHVANADVGTVSGAISYGPSHLLHGHPSLFFYGIHPAEALFTVMGDGCVSVARTSSPLASVVTGQWKDGRIGTLHAMHDGCTSYKVLKLGAKGVAEEPSATADYSPMLREIVAFFRSGVPPILPERTLHIYEFMEAAELSLRRGGDRVMLSEV
jgi:predicted dehydrogenase